MSPFMSANKIKKPLLLIHGEEDSNSGTLTMQVKYEDFNSIYLFLWVGLLCLASVRVIGLAIDTTYSFSYCFTSAKQILLHFVNDAVGSFL